MDWKEDKKDTDRHRRSVRRLSQTKISLNDMDTIDNDGVFTPGKLDLKHINTKHIQL